MHPDIHSLVATSCLTLVTPWTARLFYPWDSPGKNTGVGCRFLLQGIFLTLGLLHCRQMIYWLSYEKSPKGLHNCFLRRWKPPWGQRLLLCSPGTQVPEDTSEEMLHNDQGSMHHEPTTSFIGPSPDQDTFWTLLFQPLGWVRQKLWWSRWGWEGKNEGGGKRQNKTQAAHCLKGQILPDTTEPQASHPWRPRTGAHR